MSSENTSPRKEIVAKHQRHGTDVGSPEVQVALLTNRIETLTGHFAKHKEDNHSMRGMLKLISQRKRLLAYLKNENIERYKNTLAALGLRK